MKKNWHSMVSLLQARLNNPYPLEYMLEEALFCGEWFFIAPSVLIPRPETETAVNCVLRHAGHSSQRITQILDLGTGSGNIAIILAKKLNCDVHAVDICDKALKVAKKNAIMHRVDDKIKFYKSDWYDGININHVDIIVSNPPYVSEGEWDSLPTEVKDYEPRIALWAGKEGLDNYKKIISGAKKMLVPGGAIVLEIGCNQAGAVKNLMDGFEDIEIIKDQFGKDRVVSAIWTN